MSRRYTPVTAARLSAAVAALPLTPADRLVWVQAFCARDLSTPRARRSSLAQLRMFHLLHYKAWGASVDVAGDLQADVHPSEVPAIQRTVRDVLDHLTPGAIAWFPQPMGDGLVWRATHGVSLVTKGHGVNQVLAALADLLITIGPDLRRCGTESCRRLFVMNRPHQKYCREGCSSTERVRAWRAQQNKARLSTARHEQYKRQTTAKLPGVRVTRRQKGA